jgi:hypothetical protein
LHNLTNTGLSPSLARFPVGSCSIMQLSQVLQPPACRNIPGLGFFPFARHYLGNHVCFLLLQVLRCFSSLGSPPATAGLPVFNRQGCPIRTSADHRMCASPRSFSQLTTSFFASESLGILHTPFFTFLSMLLLFAQLLTLLNLSKNFFPYSLALYLT